MIDEVLSHLPAAAIQAAKVLPGPVPQPPNLKAIARELGVEVRRGRAERGFQGLAIPEFYSEREARVAIARRVARMAVDQVGSQCEVAEDHHNCPEPEVCEFVESAKANNKIMDTIAAAVLMPTNDFVRWADSFKGAEGPLSDSYAVPLELARIRLRTIRSAEEPVRP